MDAVTQAYKGCNPTTSQTVQTPAECSVGTNATSVEGTAGIHNGGKEYEMRGMRENEATSSNTQGITTEAVPIEL